LSGNVRSVWHPHLLMEAVDRFSRMGAQTWDMIHDLKDDGVTLRFIWEGQFFSGLKFPRRTIPAKA
jgi:DNA invertase Pin-like site-specific DNA recombinase